jgi:hypothetical protein
MKLSQRTVWSWIIGAFVLAGASPQSNAAIDKDVLAGTEAGSK